MASIDARTRKNGTTAWTVRFRIDGKQAREVFDTARDAKQFAALVDRIGGKAAREKRDAATWDQKPTFAEAFESYKHHARDLSVGTAWDYETSLTRCGAMRRFGAVPVDLITHADVEAWAAERVTYISPLTKKPLSAKTLKNEISIISAVFGHAIEMRWISENPAHRTRLPRVRKPPIRVLSDDEYSAILAHTREDFQPLVRFLATTGMRWGEATALQWRDLKQVSPGVWQVTVQRAWKRGVKSSRDLGIAKTSSSHRTITIPASLVALLGEPGKPTGFIFTGVRGGHLYHNWFLVNIWKPALMRSGVEDVTIHDLRHYCASVLLAAGVPMHTVSKRLGHSTIKTTVDTYSFLTSDMQVAGMDTMERIATLTPLNEPHALTT